MINDQRIDISEVWPIPLPRETALYHLAELIDDQEVAQVVWNDIIALLHDRQDARQVYTPTMSCRTCGAPHRASYRAVARAAKGLEPQGHAMSCQHYVGPLEHHAVRTEKAVIGWHLVCACGQTYLDEPNAACPSADVDWRGPRP